MTSEEKCNWRTTWWLSAESAISFCHSVSGENHPSRFAASSMELFTSHPHHLFTCSDSFEYSTFFLQTKWRLVFSQGGISIWVGERNFSYSRCSKFYWAPTLPTLSWDGKIGVIKFISDFKTCMLEFQLIKIWESNHFTVTNIRSKHKLWVCKSRPHGSRWFVSVFVSGTLHDTK